MSFLEIINLKLIWYKVYYFAFFGGLGCLIPYLSVYLQQLGLCPWQIGLVSFLRTAIRFLSGPLWGAIGDHFKKRYILLLVSYLPWIAIFVGFLYIPEATKLDIYQEQQHMLQANGSNGNNSFESFDLFRNLSDSEIKNQKSDISWLFDGPGLRRVFILVLTLSLVGEFLQTPALVFADTSTLQILGKKDLLKYGHQRGWGALGWCICTLMVGGIISTTNTTKIYNGITLIFSDYSTTVYVLVPFWLLAFTAATQFTFQEKTEETTSDDEASPSTPDSMTKVLKLFLCVHYGSWIITVFFTGVFNGVIWGFFSWHLLHLGADQLAVGIIDSVTNFSSFISFYLATYVIERFGHITVMYVCVFFYTVWFVVYAVATNPYMVLPVEFLRGVQFSTIGISMAVYSTAAVPTTSLTRMQGIIFGVYWGGGTACGYVTGGILIHFFGSVLSFYACAVASFIVLLLFIIAQSCSEKPGEETDEETIRILEK